ncbi:hypothetical protein [Pyxidicoccus xibeiensis]|uniref:hypothetical protein n=1 Tax=Pyxidicoccus xibeiensis TaxID=2906759 RepID=UPI0020A8208F|nr:hypothetical protein [Pyxidicoccus xibeiensis]MCP3141547.1 hypothetical protein [Pyxidicoccus xibeiensis]
MASSGTCSSFAERHAGVVATLAAAHLVLVSLFLWTGLAENPSSTPERALQTYKNLAGIFRDYRFFAPGVSSDIRAGFILQQPDGTSAFHAFLSENLEVGLRYGCIVAASMRDEKVRDVLAQSWAAVMLGQHPEATRVSVVAQGYQLPPLEEYARGARPAWKVVYAADFDRKEGQP